MKILLLIIVLVPLTVLAQQYPEMNTGNQDEMKKMMAAMKKMQVCMSKINKDELAAMRHKAEKLNRETQSLCNKGKRNQAQQKSTSAFNEFKNNPIAIKLKKCTAILEDLSSDNEITEAHICDSLENNYKN